MRRSVVLGIGLFIPLVLLVLLFSSVLSLAAPRLAQVLPSPQVLEPAASWQQCKAPSHLASRLRAHRPVRWNRISSGAGNRRPGTNRMKSSRPGSLTVPPGLGPRRRLRQ